jgi:hypothetical protein
MFLVKLMSFTNLPTTPQHIALNPKALYRVHRSKRTDSVLHQEIHIHTLTFDRNCAVQSIYVV